MEFTAFYVILCFGLIFLRMSELTFAHLYDECMDEMFQKH
jgi:hypothetical protein